jgi:hypothetical protein
MVDATPVILIMPTSAENEINGAAVARRLLARVLTLASVASCMLDFSAAS